MLNLKINNIIGANLEDVVKLCPFNAIELFDGKLSINAGCKMCKLCVKKSGGVITFEDEIKEVIDKSEWRGIAVYAEILNGNLHPVTFELVGKARELADKIHQEVFVFAIGSALANIAKQLQCCGADKIYLVDNTDYCDFNLLNFADVFSFLIEKVRPSSVLFPSTNLGRALAPRVACRFKTGLTADCTMLEIKDNSDLVQIRPAFGGNIMAQIVTSNSRPQFCTVRYKIFDRLKYDYTKAEIIELSPNLKLNDNLICLQTTEKEQSENISTAEILVAVGRGVSSQSELAMVKTFATQLNAQLACTRPLVENNMFDSKHQIGLSGRTVKPKLIVTIGISGAVQFTAGMNNSDLIIAIDKDENAPIFDVAHVGIKGDFKTILPKLIAKIKGGDQL